MPILTPFNTPRPTLPQLPKCQTPRSPRRSRRTRSWFQWSMLWTPPSVHINFVYTVVLVTGQTILLRLFLNTCSEGTTCARGLSGATINKAMYVESSSTFTQLFLECKINAVCSVRTGPIREARASANPVSAGKLEGPPEIHRCHHCHHRYRLGHARKGKTH